MIETTSAYWLLVALGEIEPDEEKEAETPPTNSAQ